MREFKNIWHALYQARMWRQYATAYHGIPTMGGITKEWVMRMGFSEAYCLEHAREAAVAARQFNLSSGNLNQTARLS